MPGQIEEPPPGPSADARGPKGGQKQPRMFLEAAL